MGYRGCEPEAEDYFQSLITHSANKEITVRAKDALKEIYTDYTFDTDAYLTLISESGEFKDESSSLSAVLLKLATDNLEKGNYEESIKQYNRILEDYPDKPFVSLVNYNLGNAYLSQNEFQKAKFESTVLIKLPCGEATENAY